VGSLIGNLADTREQLDFCAKHRIGPDIEMLGIADLNDAFKEVQDGAVQFRYVIDMASLKAQI
jgi:alcohol dehydrogenase (NADP+)